MNWLIDGAYGEHYREAMGYQALKPAIDEWELEKRPRRIRPSLIRRLRSGLGPAWKALRAFHAESEDRAVLHPKGGFPS